MNVSVLSVWDRGYSPLAKITTPNHQRYCAQQGYSWIGLGDYQCARGPVWGRFEVLADHLAQVDLLAVVDVDLIFTSMDTKLEELAEADVCLGSDMNGVNCGLMLYRRSEWSLDFVRKVWEAGPRFSHYPNPEQSTLAHLLFLEPKDRWHVHAQRVMNSYMESLYNRTNPEGEWQVGDFVLHLPSLPLNTRIDTFRRVLAGI
jgi:hypothetical protein